MFYKFAQVLVFLYFLFFFRLRVNGRGNVPKTGGVILCANHGSMMDPVILSKATPRQVHYLSKKELFKNGLIALVLRGLGAFPVDRSNTDMAAYKKTVDLLKQNRVVGVFAQGSRYKEIDARDAKAGVALFALKSGAEVIPVAINTNYKLFSKITLNIGRPVDLREYRDKKIKTEMLAEITEIIFSEVAGLMK